MKVTLLAHTDNAERLIATAGRTCYSNRSPAQLYNELDQDKIDSVLGHIHGSVFEHATFTFSIEGISRACSHQLVRHRMASYSQQSQRYVNLNVDSSSIVIPNSIHTESWDDLFQSKIYFAYSEYMDKLNTMVKVMRDNGIPDEDIRYFYPQGIKTNIVVTMNVRELMHFFSMRCCNRAQWEIRDMANLMLEECKKVNPKLFKKAGASCVQLGYCPEHKPCGRCSKKVKKYNVYVYDRIKHKNTYLGWYDSEEDGRQAQSEYVKLNDIIDWEGFIWTEEVIQ